MDGIKGFVQKMQLDRDFRISLREAKTKEEKIRIIKQSGFDVSEKDIRTVVESISKIADETFHDIGNNSTTCNDCTPVAPCDCSGQCTVRKTSNNTRIYIEGDKRNN